MTPREPLYAYRLGSSDSPHTPEMLWEWEEPYIHCLLWTAKTFGRTVVHCLFLHWNALAAALSCGVTSHGGSDTQREGRGPGEEEASNGSPPSRSRIWYAEPCCWRPPQRAR